MISWIRLSIAYHRPLPLEPPATFPLPSRSCTRALPEPARAVRCPQVLVLQGTDNIGSDALGTQSPSCQKVIIAMRMLVGWDYMASFIPHHKFFDSGKYEMRNASIASLSPIIAHLLQHLPPPFNGLFESELVLYQGPRAPGDALQVWVFQGADEIGSNALWRVVFHIEAPRHPLDYA